MICQTTALLIVFFTVVAILLFLGYKGNGWKGVLAVAGGLIIGIALCVGGLYLISFLPEC